MLVVKASETDAQSGRFVVKIYNSFEELPAGYHRLFHCMAEANFSGSLPWYCTFARTAMEEGAVLRLYGVESFDAEPAARGLLVAQSPAARRGSVLRNRHIGQRTLSGLTGYQTHLFGPLVREDDPNFYEILRCLAQRVRGERPTWEMIDFAALDRDSRTFHALVRALGSVGLVVRTYQHFGNVFEVTDGQDYTAYIASRPPWARRQLMRYERKERQLKKSGAYRANFITDEEGLDQALQDFAAVFEASWKEPDYHPDFLPTCIRAAAKAGALRLLVIYLGNEPVATQLVFLAKQRATFYRTAYHPDHARNSVGAIVKLRMIQHLLDQDHAKELDLGRDREVYKKNFALKERFRCGILAFNCTTIGGLCGLTEQMVFELRDWSGRASRSLLARLQRLRERRKADHEESLD